MPVLANHRHERFAQLLASGLDQDEAYEKAGFKPDRGHASRLATNGIKVRVAEILADAAKETAITVAHVTKRLVRIADKAEGIVDDYGPSALSVARASWMDAAKLNGLVTDNVKVSVSLESLIREYLPVAAPQVIEGQARVVEEET